MNDLLQIGNVYTGEEFNKISKCSLYRITNKKEKHNDFQYYDGLNVDTREFDPTGECKSGGLYFFDEIQVCTAIIMRVYVINRYWIRKVTIPDDARIYVEHHKYKTDKFILHERIRIGNVRTTKLHKMYDKCANIINLSLLDQIEAVKHNGLILEHITNQTEEICSEAVKQNILAIQYVKEQTDSSPSEVHSDFKRGFEFFEYPDQYQELINKLLLQHYDDKPKNDKIHSTFKFKLDIEPESELSRALKMFDSYYNSQFDQKR